MQHYKKPKKNKSYTYSEIHAKLFPQYAFFAITPRCNSGADAKSAADESREHHVILTTSRPIHYMTKADSSNR